MQWTRQHSYAAVALVVGAALRLFFVIFHAHVEGDGLVYGQLASNLLQHHTFALGQAPALHLTLIRVPGYPLLLAALFAIFGDGNLTAVLYIQVAVDLLTCLLLAATAYRLAGRRAALATLSLAALCPFTANYTAAPLTEIPAIALTALSFYALDRWQDTVSAGWWNRWFGVMAAALASGIFLRPDRSLLAVAVVLAIFSFAKAGSRTAWGDFAPVVTMLALLTLAPVLWGVRNWRVFHVLQPLAPRSASDPGEAQPIGFNRWYRTWAIDLESTANVYWAYDGSPLSVAEVPPRAFDTADQRERTIAVIQTYNLTMAASPAVDASFAELAAERIRAHPVRSLILLPVARVANMWLRPRTAMLPVALDWWHVGVHPGESAVAAAFALLNAAYLVLAAIGLWRWRRTGWSGRRALGYAMVIFVGLRCCLLLTMDNSEPRYTLDCYPVVLLFAGLAVASLMTRGRTPRDVSE